MFKELTDGIKLMFMEFFNKDTNKKQRANMWTFSRLVLAFIIPFLALMGKIFAGSVNYILAAVLTLCGTVTDFFDGKSARKYNSVSTFGKKLDILADKVFAFMLGISLSLVNPLFLFNILGETMISYTNIRYQRKASHLVPKSSYLGKIKQWPLSITFVLGYLSIFFPQLSLATNVFIFVSFGMELVVFKDYVNVNNYRIKELNLEKDNTSISSNNEDIKEKTLTDEYVNLKNVLLEIKKVKEDEQQENRIKIKKRSL